MPSGIYKRKKEMYLSRTGIKRPPFSVEWIENIRKAQKGLKKPHIGVPRSEECREKIRLAKIGKYTGNNHPNWKGGKERYPNCLRCNKRLSSLKSLRCSKCKSEVLSGEKNYRWIKDRNSLSRINKQGERRTSAYFYWRKEIWSRDNYKCRLKSLECNGRIEAHHILGWKDYPELRFIINNGITLCAFHHPRGREEEKRMIPIFQELLSVSKE